MEKKDVNKCKKDEQDGQHGPLLQCPDCTYSTNSEEKFNLHVKLNNKPELACSLCPFTSKCRMSFWNHKKKHRKFEACPYCKYSTADKHHLQRHVYKNHHEQNEKEKKVKITIKIRYCDICNYSYTDNSKFQQHAKKCKKDGSLLQCPDCTYTTNSEEKLHLHVKHNNNFELTCHLCPFASKCRPSFWNHKKKHRKYDCPYCEHLTYDKHHLQRHVYNNHKETNDIENKVKITGNVFKCTFCDYSTMNKSGFKVHEKACKRKQS